MHTETLPWNSSGSFAPGLDFHDDGSYKPEPYKRKVSPRYPVDIPGARDSDWASEWMKGEGRCGGSCESGRGREKGDSNTCDCRGVGGESSFGISAAGGYMGTSVIVNSLRAGPGAFPGQPAIWAARPAFPRDRFSQEIGWAYFAMPALCHWACWDSWQAIQDAEFACKMARHDPDMTAGEVKTLCDCRRKVRLDYHYCCQIVGNIVPRGVAVIQGGGLHPGPTYGAWWGETGEAAWHLGRVPALLLSTVRAKRRRLRHKLEGMA